MHKARKEIAEVMPQVDVIIEMLDARIPSSENPWCRSCGDTPVIKVPEQGRSADPEITELWVAHMEQEKDQGIAPDPAGAGRRSSNR